MNNLKLQDGRGRITDILVIDDEEGVCNLLTDLLTDVGYRVTAVASGEEAMQKIKETPFEIVITDLKMSGMNGIEVLRKMKNIRSDICVIVITGYGTVETAIEAMKAGAYDYISKPFDTGEMGLIVDRAAERQLLAREAREKEHYRELSIIDGLTEIYNHRYLHEILDKEITRSKRYSHPVSLLMIDIDDFKKYNDANGHLEGDRLLKRLASIILRNIREIDYVARYGGEEFAIILTETDKEGASVAARRIRSIIEESLPLTISIGLAAYPKDAETKEELIQKADRALYEAKHLGKNRVCLFNDEQRTFSP